MAKYLLLKHYRGAPEAVNSVPMDQWTPQEIDDHVQYMTTSPPGSRAPGVDAHLRDQVLGLAKGSVTGGRPSPSYRRPDPRRPQTTRCSSSSCAPIRRCPASAVALTLRAIGGLTTRQIARAYLAGGDDGAADQPGQAHGA